MNLNIVNIILTFLFLTAQFNLDAVIVRAAAFVSNPAICILGDDQIPFFKPDTTTSAEEQCKKAAKRLMRDLAKGTKQIDVILEGNQFCAQTLRGKKQEQKHDDPSIKTGSFTSLVLFAQKQKDLKLGQNVRFVFSNTMGSALSSIASFCWYMQVAGKSLLAGYLKERLRDESISVPDVEALAQKLPHDLTTPSVYDQILSNKKLRPLFFIEGGDFDLHMQNYFKNVNLNPTVKELFDQLNTVKQSIEQLEKQLETAKFPHLEIIVGIIQTITALTDALRVAFVEKYTGCPFHEIQSKHFFDIVIHALKKHDFEEVVGSLQQWFSCFSMHASFILAFNTVMQSIAQHRNVLFIASPQLSSIIHQLTSYFVAENKQGAVKEEMVIPPFIQGFNQDKIHKLMHRVRSILLDLPIPQCTSCGSCSLDLQLCSHCQNVRYCSRECQKADWPQHKLICKKEPT